MKNPVPQRAEDQNQKPAILQRLILPAIAVGGFLLLFGAINLFQSARNAQVANEPRTFQIDKNSEETRWLQGKIRESGGNFLSLSPEERARAQKATGGNALQFFTADGARQLTKGQAELDHEKWQREQAMQAANQQAKARRQLSPTPSN